MKVKLILVGGFLGAGKTTLLWKAARRLMEQNRSVGLITNDQAPDLVDTALLSRSGAGIREVSGSCFCCNFGGFVDALQSLAAQGAEIIIAEPVGSCTDLSATILQPIKDKYREIDLAPFTVLADPDRVREVLQQKDSRMHASALYILRLQMQEADRILLNKTDTLGSEEQAAMIDLLRRTFQEAKVDGVSARTGEGLDAWIQTILTGRRAGSHIVVVDYDRYAEGEAVLGWLNAVINLKSVKGETEWTQYARDLLTRLHASFQQRSAEIGHVKLAIDSDGGECTANLTRLGGDVSLQGDSRLSGTQAICTLNARVQMPPEELEAIARAAIRATEAGDISVTVQSLRCLMPGRPSPTYRYVTII